MCKLQIKDKDWDDAYVDLLDDDDIPNKSQVRAVVQSPEQALLEAARDRVIADGYQFVKGKSRSKKFSDPDERPKLNQEIRDQRMKDLEQDMSDMKERLCFKEKRILERLNLKDYKKCDELKEEVIVLRKQLRELESERKRLSLSNQRSVLYNRKRLSSSLSDTCSNESDVSNPRKSLTPTSPECLCSSPEQPSQCPLFSSQLSYTQHENSMQESAQESTDEISSQASPTQQENAMCDTDEMCIDNDVELTSAVPAPNSASTVVSPNFHPGLPARPLV